VETVLVLRALGLGDLLTAVPALRAVRRARPAARLVLAAPAGLRELALLTGAVDELVPVGPLEPLPPSVAGADLAVNLHGRGPQSTALLAATAPRRLLSYGLPGGPQWRADEHEVQRWCRLLEDSGLPADPSDLALAAPDVPALVQGGTLVHPVRRSGPATGRSSGGRRWRAGSRQPGTTSGSPAARGSASSPSRSPRRRARAGPGAGRPDRPARADRAGRRGPLLVSVDTGVAHLATALGTPSVVLFGPTSAGAVGPAGPRPAPGAVGRPHGGQLRRPPDPGLLELARRRCWRPRWRSGQVRRPASVTPGEQARDGASARRGGLPRAACATLCATLDATAPLPPTAEEPPLNRTELVNAVAQASGVSSKDVDATLKSLQQVVSDTVAKGEEKITIPGFLSFEQVDRAAREGRNPSTGETIQIAASKAVKVTAGSALKNAAAGK
jgi:nucleoid DNA-binding protein